VTKRKDERDRRDRPKRKYRPDAGPREQDAPRIDGCPCHGVALGEYGQLFHDEQSPILAERDTIVSCGHKVGPDGERQIVWWHQGRIVCTGCRPHMPGHPEVLGGGGRPTSASDLRVAFSTLPGALSAALDRDDGLPIPSAARRYST